ncbi:hypothetical protein NS44R_15165 [Mammaliicoccus sciuri]|nr:hypothetical protein NS44R_15165 [Mammaliicoccus sciuri]
MQGHKGPLRLRGDGGADGEMAHRAEHPHRPRMGQVRGPVAGTCQARGVPGPCAVQSRGPPPALGARRRCAGAAGVQGFSPDVDPAGLWPRAARTGARR